jgi:hypothetical protein
MNSAQNFGIRQQNIIPNLDQVDWKKWILPILLVLGVAGSSVDPNMSVTGLRNEANAVEQQAQVQFKKLGRFGTNKLNQRFLTKKSLRL